MFGSNKKAVNKSVNKSEKSVAQKKSASKGKKKFFSKKKKVEKFILLREINYDMAQKFFLKHKENLVNMFLTMGFDDTIYTPIVENEKLIHTPLNIKNKSRFRGTTTDIPCIYYQLKDGKKGVMACYKTWKHEPINVWSINREDLGECEEACIYEHFKKDKYENKDGMLVRKVKNS